MTTDNPQLQLVSDDEQQRHLESRALVLLHRLTTWAATPDDRIDWELEALLDDLRATSTALRDLRGESDLPF